MAAKGSNSDLAARNDDCIYALLYALLDLLL